MAQAERDVFILSLGSLFVQKLHALVAAGQSNSIWGLFFRLLVLFCMAID